MIIFLIPVKSPKHINDPKVFNRLLSTTLKSCLNVSNSKTIVVTNSGVQIPPNMQHRVNHLVVPETNLEYGDRDKESKMYSGCLFFLNYFSPEDHLMPLDCDDLVSKDVCLAAHKNCNTSFLKGYLKIWNKGYLQKNFFHRNGSSHILCYDYVNELCKEPLREGFLFHQLFDETSFIPCQNPLVLQRTCHGENVYYKKSNVIKNFFKYLISHSISKEEFGQ